MFIRSLKISQKFLFISLQIPKQSEEIDMQPRFIRQGDFNAIFILPPLKEGDNP